MRGGPLYPYRIAARGEVVPDTAAEVMFADGRGLKLSSHVGPDLLTADEKYESPESKELTIDLEDGISASILKGDLDGACAEAAERRCMAPLSVLISVVSCALGGRDVEMPLDDPKVVLLLVMFTKNLDMLERFSLRDWRLILCYTCNFTLDSLRYHAKRLGGHLERNFIPEALLCYFLAECPDKYVELRNRTYNEPSTVYEYARCMEEYKHIYEEFCAVGGRSDTKIHREYLRFSGLEYLEPTPKTQIEGALASLGIENLQRPYSTTPTTISREEAAPQPLSAKAASGTYPDLVTQKASINSGPPPRDRFQYDGARSTARSQEPVSSVGSVYGSLEKSVECSGQTHAAGQKVSPTLQFQKGAGTAPKIPMPRPPSHNTIEDKGAQAPSGIGSLSKTRSTFSSPENITPEPYSAVMPNTGEHQSGLETQRASYGSSAHQKYRYAEAPRSSVQAAHSSQHISASSSLPKCLSQPAHPEAYYPSPTSTFSAQGIGRPRDTAPPHPQPFQYQGAPACNVPRTPQTSSEVEKTSTDSASIWDEIDRKIQFLKEEALQKKGLIYKSKTNAAISKLKAYENKEKTQFPQELTRCIKSFFDLINLDELRYKKREVKGRLLAEGSNACDKAVREFAGVADVELWLPGAFSLLHVVLN